MQELLELVVLAGGSHKVKYSGGNSRGEVD